MRADLRDESVEQMDGAERMIVDRAYTSHGSYARSEQHHVSAGHAHLALARLQRRWTVRLQLLSALELLQSCVDFMRIAQWVDPSVTTVLVGDFRKAVIWDRQQASISATDSHADFFIRNLVAILGGVDDKRPLMNHPADATTNKLLILEGTCVLGGIDIRSY